MKNNGMYRFNKQKYAYNRFDNQSELSNASYSSFSSTSFCNIYTSGAGTIKNLIFSNNNGNESSQNELFVNELIPISIPTTLNNSISFSPSSSSSKSTPLHSTGFNTPVLKNKSTVKNNKHSLDEFLTKAADIMIYLNLKETSNNIDFNDGFKNFILSHYRENPNFFNDQIKKFNNFRQVNKKFSQKNRNLRCFKFDNIFKTFLPV